MDTVHTYIPLARYPTPLGLQATMQVQYRHKRRVYEIRSNGQRL